MALEGKYYNFIKEEYNIHQADTQIIQIKRKKNTNKWEQLLIKFLSGLHLRTLCDYRATNLVSYA